MNENQISYAEKFEILFQAGVEGLTQAAHSTGHACAAGEGADIMTMLRGQMAGQAVDGYTQGIVASVKALGRFIDQFLAGGGILPIDDEALNELLEAAREAQRPEEPVDGAPVDAPGVAIPTL